MDRFLCDLDIDWLSVREDMLSSRRVGLGAELCPKRKRYG